MVEQRSPKPPVASSSLVSPAKPSFLKKLGFFIFKHLNSIGGYGIIKEMERRFL